MRRWICLWLAAGIALLTSAALPAAAADSAIVLTEEEKAYIAEHPTLKVGFVQDRIPVSFTDENGEFAGISRYILDRVSELSGLTFEYAPLPAGDVTYDYLTSSGYDLVTSVEYNEENKKANGILISEPYLSSRKVIVAKEGMQFSYSGNWSVAVSTGSQTLKKVLARTFPSFQLKDYASISDCFDAVNAGNADLMIQNQFVVEYWLSKPKYEKLQVIPVMGLDDQHCFSAVVDYGGTESMPQEEGAVLISILDKAIACVGEDEQGSYVIQGVMENQYEYELEDFLNRYRYAVGIFIVSFLLIIVLVCLLMRQRLRAAQSQADARAKGEFLSTMSHEIRTPLNGLIGLNHLMTQKLDERGKLEEYLRQSSETAKYLLSLINDILDSSKLEAQSLALELQPIDLSFVTETVSSIESNAMAEKGLHYTAQTDLPYPYVTGDAVRIQQVLLNLLDNARKFTPKGGSITMTAAQTMEEQGRVLTTVTVTDTGRGMSEAFQKQLFQIFSQEADTVSKGDQGTGLGLSISRRLARLMGGDLTCVSQKGKGSTFTFTFKADPAQRPEQEFYDGTAETESLPRVLVAEDNELNGEIIRELLTGEGFQVTLAENGKIALRTFIESAPGTYGVILMDLRMPEMDGFETTKAIRALNRPDAATVRIFACTANSFAEDRDKALESGMDDFIAKPIDMGTLLRKLKQKKETP